MNIIKEIVEEHFHFRSQILKLAKSDLVKTYKGSFLGWIWAVVKPAVTIFVYWFAFEVGMKSGQAVNEYPFFFWLLAGILPWFYMNEMIVYGSNTIRKYSYLVTKMKFPVSTIPTFVSISKFIIHLVLSVIVILIFLLCGYPVDVYYLQLPLYMAVMFGFFTSWSLLSSPLSAMSRDFVNFIKSITMAIFWLSGIIWNVDTIGIPWLRKILYFNPVTFFATGYRNVFINKRWFFEDKTSLMCFAFVYLCTIILSLLVYKKLKKDIPDVL